MTRAFVSLLIFCCLALSLRAEDAKSVSLFNGKNLDGWKPKGPANRSYWTVGKASLSTEDPLKLIVGKTDAEADLMNGMDRSVDLYTEAKFGDCLLEIEVMVPKNGDSGVYLMGEYQIQIVDSFGKGKLSPGGMGGIYATAGPKVNASKPPGEWQKFEVEFRAPRFEGEKKLSPARFVKVTLNGQLIHENVEVPGPTAGGLTGKEAVSGPILLQGGHSTIAYRNLKLTPR